MVLFPKWDRKGLSLVGSRSSCPGAGAASKAIYGLHPRGSRATATCKHGKRFVSCRKSWNLGIKSKKDPRKRLHLPFAVPLSSLISPSKMILKSYQCFFASGNKQHQLPVTHHFSSAEAMRNQNTRHTRHTVNLPVLNCQEHPKQCCS